MALYVNTNISAIDAANNLNTTETSLEKTTQQLSSGLRINSAADDAAGLTISQNLQGQINGVDQANRNSQDGVSLVQTAAGALTQVQSMLQRIRELAVQYGNGTLNSTDRSAIVSEVDQLASEIEQIGSTTEFNGIHVLNSATTITFQVGANDSETIAAAAISLGAIASVASAFQTSAADVAASTFTQSQVQAAYDQAFATVFGPHPSATPAMTSGTIPNGASYGDGSTVGGGATVGSNVSFGANSIAGGGSTFGANDVFGAGTTVGGGSTFAAGTVFGADSIFGGGSTFGADTVFGAGSTFGGGSSYGAGTVYNATDDTSWSLFLSGAGNVAALSGAQLQTAVTSFLGGQSEPAGDVAQFASAFTSALSQTAPTANISQIDAAIGAVSGAASTLGAVQNRLQYTMANLSTYEENLTSANSRIMDVDMASAMTSFTSEQVLQQAGTAMLTQAQKLPDAVLSLLQAA
jgi:flagellin